MWNKLTRNFVYTFTYQEISCDIQDFPVSELAYCYIIYVVASSEQLYTKLYIL